MSSKVSDMGGGLLYMLRGTAYPPLPKINYQLKECILTNWTYIFLCVHKNVHCLNIFITVIVQSYSGVPVIHVSCDGYPGMLLVHYYPYS